MNDPALQKILQNPEIMKAVQTGDIAALMRNLRFQVSTKQSKQNRWEGKNKHHSFYCPVSPALMMFSGYITTFFFPYMRVIHHLKLANLLNIFRKNNELSNVATGTINAYIKN